jgi:hypothetical protein
MNPLTNEEKEKFEREFRKIMLESPEILQAKWNKIINWDHMRMPMIDGDILYRLPQNLFDRYVDLLRPLLDRRLGDPQEN